MKSPISNSIIYNHIFTVSEEELSPLDKTFLADSRRRLVRLSLS